MPEHNANISDYDTKISEERKTLLVNKKLLNFIYRDWYKQLLESDQSNNLNKNIVIELGAGPSFVKTVNPNIYTTDILPISSIDFTSDATLLPIKSNSVHKFIMINVFHHIHDSNKFLNELDRCLVNEGKVLMIEPFNTVWGRFIWKYFHHEEFNPKTKEWKVNGADPLYSANGALPWIVFERDKDIFYSKYPNFKIIGIRNHSFITYLLSGGFSHRQLIPSKLIYLFLTLDKIVCKYFKQLGIFATIELRKVI